jgi:hypothetical protein
LDLRFDVVAGQKTRKFYGPHTGNPISHYLVVKDKLLAAEAGGTKLWELDNQSGSTFGTIQAPVTTKEWTAEGPTFSSPDGRYILWEVLSVEIKAESTTNISAKFDDEVGTQTLSVTTGTTSRTVLSFRPRRRARSMKVTLTNTQAQQFEIFSLGWRLKQIRRQIGT